MVAYCRSTSVNSARNSQGRILRGLTTPVSATTSIQDSEMESRFSLHLFTDNTQEESAQGHQQVPQDDLKEEFEEKLEALEGDSIPASESVYTICEELQSMIEAALKVHEKTRLKRHFATWFGCYEK